MEAIMLRIRKERKTKNSPRMAKVKVFLAPSTVFASPPENISWYPAKIIINREMVPAIPMAQRMTLAIKGKMQLRVRTGPLVESTNWQPLYMNKE
jgi:hypothetical protein